ncbi:MAG: hypothetical protein QXG44_09840 [Candidatus Jordarchaeaceae archaeon]
MRLDFDPKLQSVFNETYSRIYPTDWRSWLDISSRIEYESLALELSGLANVDGILERIKKEVTDPKQLSVEPRALLDSYSGSEPVVCCHTSGTSGGTISDLKFYHISEELAKRLWAPGMRAIFEASGLSPDSSAVIFVPNRISGDGMIHFNKKTLVKLYSSEFSQRLMLSLIKPHSYLLYEYKNSNNPIILEKVLSLENISIFSAPASTILGWADLDKLRQSLKSSLKALVGSRESSDLTRMISNLGIGAAAVELQKLLSKALSQATIVFSISSMTENDWSKIRKFMGWKKGSERYTNLYVGSEVGPFAANIDRDDSGLPLSDRMLVFPLSLPVVKRGEKIEPISRSREGLGHLMVSRLNGSKPVINIDTGDVVTIVDQRGLPKIGGQVLRSSFPLKIGLKFSRELKIPKGSKVFVGDYFNIKGLEIANPHRLLMCLSSKCKMKERLSALILADIGMKQFVMILPISQSSRCTGVEDIKNKLSQCPGVEYIRRAIQRNQLRLETINSQPFETETPRTELLKRVKNGELPKGILKRWPLYLIIPSTTSAP